MNGIINNTGKNALIFGIRNDMSIAWSIAKHLAGSGCQIACSYLPETKDEVLSLMDSINANKDLSGEVNVRVETTIENFARKMYDKMGGFDYILHAIAFGNNNVMCTRPQGVDTGTPVARYIDIPFDDIVESFDISAYSLIRICRCVDPYLNNGSSILALSYNASQRVMPNYAGMSINKAALENMSMYLSHYYGPQGTRVNVISSGLIMTTSAAGVSGVRALRKRGKQIAPLGNIKAEDVANAALYYFSDLSKKVTGNIHYVDGGINKVGICIDDEPKRVL